MLKFIIQYIILSLIIIFSMLIAVSFFTLLERKVLAGMQRRHGPIFTGYFGLLQPFADGLKLFLKEISIPAGGYYYIFLGSSILSLTLSLLTWSVIPFNSKFVIADLNFGMLFILFISSLNVYATLFSGWSSNSKYGLLGSIRAGAQMISYELPMTLSLLPIGLYASSFNLTNIVIFQQENFWFIYFIPAAYIFFVAALAETNRIPFDLPEAESELVAGYNIEYSSLPFAFFFLAEYNHMLVMSFLFSILFLAGWSNFSTFFIAESELEQFFCFFTSEYAWVNYIVIDFYMFPSDVPFYNFLQSVLFYSNELIESSVLTFKAILIALLFISIRAVAPRYKYIQLIKMCWSIFIPVLLLYLTLVVYAYAGTAVFNGSRVEEEDSPEYDAAWFKDYLEREYMSHVPADGSINPNNYDWVKAEMFWDVWSDERFQKYLLVKYDYIFEYEYPFSAWFCAVESNQKLAAQYIVDYYDDIVFKWIFNPAVREELAGCSKFKDIVLPVNGTDEELLEAYFCLEKGTIKPLESYINESDHYDCTKRYDSLESAANTKRYLEEEYMSYMPADGSLPNDYEWVKASMFNEVWIDERFQKYLLVKYKYIFEYKYPFSAWYSDIESNQKLAAKFIKDYYQDIDFRWIFDPAVREELAGCSKFKNIVLPVNGTDEELLEAYFGLEKGTIKPMESYSNPENIRDCSKRD